MSSSLVLTTEMWMVFGVLAATVLIFVFDLLRVDVAAILILVTLGLTGLVPSDELFSGFASNAVIAIIAVMILGAGLDRTGVMALVAGVIMRIGGRSEAHLMALISASVGLISGFMQNVGACALFLPVVSRIAGRTKLPLSRLLMPMAFCAIVGGTLTLVGSSPLILLNDLLQSSAATQGTTFSLFSVTPIGLLLLVATILYFLVVGRHLLPKDGKSSSIPGMTSAYFARTYGVEGDLYELLVTADSPLVGLTIGETEQLERAPFVLAIANGEDRHLAPASDEMVWVGTVLGVMGSTKQVRGFARDNELVVQPQLRNFGDKFNPIRAGISEAVIPPGSSWIGRSLSQIRLRKRFGISVLALHRGDEVFSRDLREMDLRAGDTLVIHSSWRDLARLEEPRDMVVITDFPREEQRPNKVQWALGFFALAIGLILTTDVPLAICLLVGALGMVLSGVLNIDEAYEAVSWKTVFLLAGLIPLGIAMDRSNAAAWLAQSTVELLGQIPEIGMLFVVGVLTTLFSLFMSNVGATVLLVPIAINIAVAVGADPAHFALLVALTASNAFLIPTHQVNALVLGPGNYRVADFLRVGGLMSLLFLIVVVAGITWMV